MDKAIVRIYKSPIDIGNIKLAIPYYDYSICILVNIIF